MISTYKEYLKYTIKQFGIQSTCYYFYTILQLDHWTDTGGLAIGLYNVLAVY